MREDGGFACVNRKEDGKRKRGFTCIDTLLDSEKEDGYIYRQRVGGMRGGWRDSDRLKCASSEETSLYTQWTARIWQMKEMMRS